MKEEDGYTKLFDGLMDDDDCYLPGGMRDEYGRCKQFDEDGNELLCGFLERGMGCDDEMD